MAAAVMCMHRTAVIAALLVGLILGVVATVSAGPITEAVAPDRPSFETTDIRSSQTFDPVCDPPSEDSTGPDPVGTHIASHPVDRGRLLSINTTITVDHPDTTLSTRVSEIGPHRYRLDVTRSPGTATADCDLVGRYNVTLNVTHEDVNSYTIIVTHDNEVESVLWAAQQSSGASARSEAGGSSEAGAGASAGGSADQSADSSDGADHAGEADERLRRAARP
jgi:hypothetical protein